MRKKHDSDDDHDHTPIKRLIDETPEPDQNAQRNAGSTLGSLLVGLLAAAMLLSFGAFLFEASGDVRG